MNYIIAVDGGGTKTEAVAYNLFGDELVSSTKGFGNIMINRETALKNIIDSINECIIKVNEKYGSSECLFIYAGLAGVEAGDYKEYIREILNKRFKTDVMVINDAELAHASLLNGGDGILTISGTGSISIGIKDGRIERTGGWGHLLGDEGSGYYIAIRALKRAALEEDSRLSKSLLTNEIMKKLNINKIEYIKEFVYSSSKGEIASLAKIVEICADSDEYANRILTDAGKELAKITCMVAQKLDFEGKVMVGIKGSIITKMNAVKKSFKESLNSKLKEVVIIEDNTSPVKGGYYLSMKELNSKSF
ncbi:MAG: ATPase [Caloramator sp.]|nr:ATPase [Caloramator sp.]